MKVIIGFGTGGTQDESKSEPQVNQPIRFLKRNNY